MYRPAFREALSRDVPLRLVALIYLAVGTLYFLPLTFEQLENLAWYYVGHVLLLVSIAAAQVGLRSSETPSGQRFWNYFSGALCLVLAGALVEAKVPEMGDQVLGSLLVDCIYASYYVTLVFATELRPDLGPSTPGRSREEELHRGSAVSFIIAILFYCSVIPSQRNPDEYMIGRYSVLLSLCLDIFFLTRFAYLSGVASSARWRLVYRLLFFYFSASVALLSVQFHATVAPSPVPSYLGTKWDLLWYLAAVPFILAARVSRYVDPEASTSGPDDDQKGLYAPHAWEPMAFYAIAFPLLHLILDSYGQLSEPSHAVQQGLVIVYFAFFGILALVHSTFREKKRRLAERALRESENRQRAESERQARLASLGQFSAALAHEIRNPLAAIVMHSFFLAERLAKDDENLRTLADINAAVDRMQKLVAGILGFVRPAALQIVEEDLVAVIDSATLDVQRQVDLSKISLVEDYHHHDATVEVDVHQMVTVFSNILLNAVRAMPDGGILSVRIDNPSEERVEVVIEDTGGGIAEEDLERIFEPFFTRRDDGVGLGLALAARVLDQHACRYRVESEPGAGTRFIVDLDLAGSARLPARRDPGDSRRLARLVGLDGREQR